jgi:hypothetical protein
MTVNNRAWRASAIPVVTFRLPVTGNRRPALSGFISEPENHARIHADLIGVNAWSEH